MGFGSWRGLLQAETRQGQEGEVMGMSWKCEPWVLGKVVTSAQGLVLVQTYGSSPDNHTSVPCPPEPVAAD